MLAREILKRITNINSFNRVRLVRFNGYDILLKGYRFGGLETEDLNHIYYDINDYSEFLVSFLKEDDAPLIARMSKVSIINGDNGYLFIVQTEH